MSLIVWVAPALAAAEAELADALADALADVLALAAEADADVADPDPLEQPASPATRAAAAAPEPTFTN